MTPSFYLYNIANWCMEVEDGNVVVLSAVFVCCICLSWLRTSLTSLVGLMCPWVLRHFLCPAASGCFMKVKVFLVDSSAFFGFAYGNINLTLHFFYFTPKLNGVSSMHVYVCVPTNSLSKLYEWGTRGFQWVEQPPKLNRNYSWLQNMTKIVVPTQISAPQLTSLIPSHG